jgi:hypothetical protein
MLRIIGTMYCRANTKLFIHVSSRNMFPTTRNLQISVHVYRPRHCCGDWLTFSCFWKKYIYIFCVYHIRIITKNNWFTRHETDRFLNNYCQECVCAYISIHDWLSFLHEVMISNHRDFINVPQVTTKVIISSTIHCSNDSKHV